MADSIKIIKRWRECTRVLDGDLISYDNGRTAVVRHLDSAGICIYCDDAFTGDPVTVFTQDIKKWIPEKMSLDDMAEMMEDIRAFEDADTQNPTHLISNGSFRLRVVVSRGRYVSQGGVVCKIGSWNDKYTCEELKPK